MLLMNETFGSDQKGDNLKVLNHENIVGVEIANQALE